MGRTHLFLNLLLPLLLNPPLALLSLSPSGCHVPCRLLDPLLRMVYRHLLPLPDQATEFPVSGPDGMAGSNKEPEPMTSRLGRHPTRGWWCLFHPGSHRPSRPSATRWAAGMHDMYPIESPQPSLPECHLYFPVGNSIAGQPTGPNSPDRAYVTCERLVLFSDKQSPQYPLPFTASQSILLTATFICVASSPLRSEVSSSTFEAQEGYNAQLY